MVNHYTRRNHIYILHTVGMCFCFCLSFYHIGLHLKQSKFGLNRHAPPPPQPRTPILYMLKKLPKGPSINDVMSFGGIFDSHFPLVMLYHAFFLTVVMQRELVLLHDVISFMDPQSKLTLMISIMECTFQ